LEQGIVYEPRTIDFICNHAKTGDVVTGGAFIGDFLPAISSALAKGAMLHSFEPHPISFAAASKTIEINRMDNTVLHPFAVGAAKGKAALTLVNEQRGGEIAGGTARIDNVQSGREAKFVDVEVTTLDALIAKDRNVSVLHLDIEGFEEPALLGAVETVTRCKPFLVLETHKISAAWLNSIFPGCNYVAASFFEKNTFYLPLP
jgi:FkbM family methyltransferase